jgi:hypothetical protein
MQRDEDENAIMRSKLAKQRSELARMTELIKQLSEDKRKLVLDLERLRKMIGGDNG